MRVVRGSARKDHSGPSSTRHVYVFPGSSGPVSYVIPSSEDCEESPTDWPGDPSPSARLRMTLGCERALRDGVQRSVTPAGSTHCQPFSGCGIAVNGSTAGSDAGSQRPPNVHAAVTSSSRGEPSAAYRLLANGFAAA